MSIAAVDARDPEAMLAHARRLAEEAGGASLELLRWQATVATSDQPSDTAIRGAWLEIPLVPGGDE